MRFSLLILNKILTSIYNFKGHPRKHPLTPLTKGIQTGRLNDNIRGK